MSEQASEYDLPLRYLTIHIFQPGEKTMAYEEPETKRSRVVVETPTARREVTRTEQQYIPERSGTSAAMVAVMVILGIGVAVLLALLIMNRQSNENANLAAQQAASQPTQQPVIVQQPAPQQQPPIIVQQPAAPAAQPPVIVNPTAGNGALDDGIIQTEIDKRIRDNEALTLAGITATVTSGKVTLMGSVKSDQLKSQAEKLVRAVKGVKNVDNQIVVVSG
jgi:BON domain